MDSAKMIAVKEVELDCESPERAQAVSHGPDSQLFPEILSQPQMLFSTKRKVNRTHGSWFELLVL